MLKKISVALIAMVLILCAGTGAMAVTTTSQVQDNTVVDGVYIEDLNLSGLTEAEVKAAIAERVTKMGERTVTVKTDGKKDTVKPADLGLTWTNTEIVDEIMSLGKTGNVIARFKELQDLKRENKVYELSYDIDESAVKKFAKQLKKTYNQESEEPTITRSNGKFKVTKGKNGIKVNVTDTMNAIETAILGETKGEDITVKTVCEVTKPEHSYKDLKKIKKVLGSKRTTYDAGNRGRTQSLELSTKRLNGTVVWPGETISVSLLMGERSKKGGYGTAQGYIGTNVEDTVGAGICQTATTLYNAALWAELDIAERHHHTLIVHYVPYSMDSTIYAGNDYKNPSKDLKLKNPYDYPIYIEASAGRGVCTFKIWGKETRPENRTIKYVPTTVYETYPSTESVTYDSSQYEGYSKVVQGAFPKVKAYLTKYVYENGKQVSKKVLHTDTYKGSARQVIKGSKKKVEETKADDDNKDDSDDKKDKKDDKNSSDKKDNKTDKDKKDESSKTEE